ncbi:VOC family protein [Microbacterium suwonense]|uniref:Glyoxalase/bleomycin resistance protein n=1 Tax=Microbacterium suwonense TaxID=683047 RepID=A0ABN6X0W4_9MICO|nr:VOC family protein [Microbacterium suwonense]BDZ38317.1 putative glyoxalase/bleomycin resistance protein [Microbacterium suwonense]
MDITIKASFLPYTDAEASVVFYRDIIGFEVRMDVGQGRMRWVTVGPVGQPDTAIVLTPPAVDPGISDDERTTILELMAKGSYGGIVLETPDVDAAFAAIEAKGADVVQEPIDQPYGIRDCAFRDPAGNMVRLQQSA